MNKHYKISIVTPSFNQGEFLEETILSIINQNYPNLEYIIVDGGSSDNSVEIIKKYEEYITYWISEKDNGQSHAINKGLEKCTGDIFIWINSDDYLEAGILELINKSFTPTTGLIIGHYTYVQGDRKKLKSPPPYFESYEKYIGLSYIDQPATFFNLKNLKKLSPLNEVLNFAMDTELWLRYVINFNDLKVNYIDQNISFYRLHDNSKTIQEGNFTDPSSRFFKETRSVYYSIARNYKLFHEADLVEKISNIKLNKIDIRDLNPSYKEIVRKSLNYYICELAINTYYSKKYKFARNILNKVNKEILDLEYKNKIDNILKNYHKDRIKSFLEIKKQ